MLTMSYAIAKIDADTLEQLRNEVDFDRLVADTSVSRGIRCRRYSSFRLHLPAKIDLLPHRDFTQPDANGHLRSAARRFAPLVREEAPRKAWRALRALLRCLLNVLQLTEAEVEVHAIRACAAPEVPGIPAPEGLHSDGFDYVAIAVVSAPPQGAETTLVSTSDARAVSLGRLPTRSLLVFNDVDYLHFTDDFHASGSANVTRDVLVLTVRSSPNLQ